MTPSKRVLKLLLFIGLACLAPVFSVSLSAQGKNVRMWKNKDGVEVMMQFIRMDGDAHCIMKTKDGREHRFPLALLAEEDRKIALRMPNSASAQTILRIIQPLPSCNVISMKGV